MKRKLALAILLLVLCAALLGVLVFTTSAETEGYYTYTVWNKQAIITDVDVSISGDIAIPDTLGGYPVTEIENRAFANCTAITSLTIPKGVTVIGEEAFSGCTALTAFEIPTSVTNIGGKAFKDCTALESVTLPFLGKNANDTSKNYFAYLFSGYNAYSGYMDVPDSLKTVVLTKETDIGTRAFYGIGSLTQITLPEGVTSIGDSAFYGTGLSSIVIPSSVTSIGERVLSYCESLTEIKVAEGNTVYHSEENCLIETASGTLVAGCSNSSIPTDGSVTSIGIGAFAGVKGLTQITLPDTVTSIGSSAFSDCVDLISVAIPEGVTSIGGSAFYGCSKLVEVYNCSTLSVTKGSSSNGYVAFNAKNVYTPTSGESKLSTVDDFVFYNDNGAYTLIGYQGDQTELTLPAEIKESSYEIHQYAFFELPKLKAVVIPDGVTKIGRHSFYGCSGIETVSMGDDVTVIDDYAFEGCTALTAVVFGESSGLVSIENSAFGGCESLASFDVPSTVTSIDDSAFWSCKKLGEISLPEGITHIGVNPFEGTAYHMDDSNWENGVLYIGKYLIEAQKTVSGTYTIKEGTTLIAESAFRECESLEGIGIPSSLKKVEALAFYLCSGLKGVYITDLTAWCGIEFLSYGDNPLFYAGNLYLNGELVTDLVIPDDVTEIMSFAFEHCTSITSVTFHEGVTSIGNRAFSYCRSLPSLTIPESVTTIGEDAFSGCTALSSITVAKNSQLTEIGNAFSGCTAVQTATVPSIVIPVLPKDSLKTVVINGGTSIGIEGEAFEGCTTLESVTLPEELEHIGDFAFEGCTSLSSITLPEGLKSIEYRAFAECTSLSLTTLPEGLERIGHQAFAGCTSLSSITIPESVTSIEGALFDYCTGLTQIALPFSEAYDVRTVLWGVELPENVEYLTVVITSGTTIPMVPLGYFGGITVPFSVDLPEGVTSIGENAFSYATGLVQVTIPESVTSIGEYAFRNCTGLSSITIPEGVTSIGREAFKNCTGLKAIALPKSVESIEYGVLSGCTNIEDLVLPFVGESRENGFYSYLGYIFANSLSSNYTNNYVPSSLKTVSITDSTWVGGLKNCTSLTTVILPEGVTSINPYAFENCTSLGSIEIPSSVTSIGKDAFRYCSSLTSLVIPNGVTSISDGTFAGCTSLAQISVPFVSSSYSTSFLKYWFDTIPSSLKTVVVTGGESICSYAFRDCVDLETVILPDTVTSIDEWAFNGCTSLVSIEIPSSVTSVGYYAFYNCTSLTSVAFGADSMLESIGDSAFRSCTSLASVTFGENSALESIGHAAFSDCTSLASIEIPSGVTSIERFAFQGCTGLKTVTVPLSLEISHGYSFSGCEAIETVYYAGARRDWDQIVFEDYYSDPTCYGATLICAKVTYTFLGEDGVTVISTETVDRGTVIVAPTAPQKAEDGTYVYAFASWEGFTEGMTATEDITFKALYTAIQKGAITLMGTVGKTAWGLDFETVIKSGGMEGAGAVFTLRVDPLAAKLVSFEAADGVTVTVEENAITVTVLGEFASGETLVTLTLTASEFLPTGKTPFLSLSENALAEGTFAPIVIYQMGDVNMDGAVDDADAQLIVKHAVKMISLDAVQLAYADMNTDGALNAYEPILFRQYLAEKDVTLGNRVEATFVFETEEKTYTVPSGEALTAIPEAPTGYLWSETEDGYTAPDFEAITADKKFYLVKEEA